MIKMMKVRGIRPTVPGMMPMLREARRVGEAVYEKLLRELKLAGMSDPADYFYALNKTRSKHGIRAKKVLTKAVPDEANKKRDVD